MPFSMVFSVNMYVMCAGDLMCEPAYGANQQIISKQRRLFWLAGIFNEG